MRFVGLLLLVFGAALCASVVWAAVGFLAMALGLICIQVRTKRLSVPGDACVSGERAVVLSEPPIASSDRSSAQAATLEGEAPRKGLAWSALPDQDEELADVERLLSRYGASYADQFRRLYCIFNSKELLPSIVSLIVEAAKLEAGTSSGVLDKSPNPQEHGREDTESPHAEQSIMAVNGAPANSSGGIVASPSFDPSRNDAKIDVTDAGKATIDSEDITSFMSIFDQLNRSRN